MPKQRSYIAGRKAILRTVYDSGPRKKRMLVALGGKQAFDDLLAQRLIAKIGRAKGATYGTAEQADCRKRGGPAW